MFTFQQTSGFGFPGYEGDIIFGFNTTFDIDLDGDWDLITGQVIFPPNEPVAQPFSVVLNDGNDQFTERADGLLFPSDTPLVMNPFFYFEDITGDLIPDILTADFGYDAGEQNGYFNRLYVGQQDGTFSLAEGALPQVSTSTYTHAVADVDRDGDLDIVDYVIGIGSAPTQFLINDGQGNFSIENDRFPEGRVILPEGAEFGLTSVSYYSVALLDGDGQLGPDLVLGPDSFAADVYGITSPVIYYNDGTGRYDPARSDPLPSSPLAGTADYEAIEGVDLDGDGDDEIIVMSQRTDFDAGNETNWSLQILERDSDGIWQDVTSMRAGTVTTTGPGGAEFVQILDVDLDDDMDIFSFRGSDEVTGAQPTLWLNNGEGHFTEEFRSADFSAVIHAFGQNAAGTGILFAEVFADSSEERISAYSDTSITAAPLHREGGTAPDILHGAAYDDRLEGKGAGDILLGLRGNDVLDGGAGTDKAIYLGNQASYTLTLSPTSITITDRRLDGDGTDTLIDVEFLDFDSGAFDPFDLTAFGGTADLSSADFENFIELYIAYFNRAPDAVGLNFWGTAFANGTSLEEIANLFIDQDETRATYPSSLSNADFVTAVYANVLGRAADQVGYDFWVGVLDDGSVGRDQFILAILGGAKADPPPGATAEFITQQLADQSYLSNKTDLGAYYAVHKGMSDVANASAAMALFDGSQTSLDAAVTAIDGYYQSALNATTGEFLMPVIGVLDDPFG